ncbi:MAG: hypothetical protein HDS84_06810 [Bacteroidales bacterium]|nr:hypothetical protein [Bacteroidales bacterium]
MGTNVPQLEAIISKTWGKEDELKQLKSELAPHRPKPSMVAEPQPRYPMPANAPRFPARHSGI